METSSTKPVVDSSNPIGNGKYVEVKRCACNGYTDTSNGQPDDCHCTDASIGSGYNPKQAY